MIVKRNFNPIRVASYVRNEMIASIGVATLVYFIHEVVKLELGLPFSIAAILGSALAIFIAFRNNSAYSRWWEARTQWSNILNASRVLSRLTITFADSHKQQSDYNSEQSEGFKKDMVYSCIAWANALRHHLRANTTSENIQPYLSDDNWFQVSSAHNKPLLIMLKMGEKVYEAMANGTLKGFDSFQIEGQLLALSSAQTACERIKNTPMLRQYDFFTRLFLYTFITILPFALINDFAKMGIIYALIPVSVLVSFVFAIIGKVGEVNEDPFENRITDVPMTSICTSIERDLKAMLGEKNLPELEKPKNGFLF